MRLATWNCCRGRFELKSAMLDGLLPDVAVLQEVARPQSAQAGVLWFGENPNIGMAVVARAPYRLASVPALPNVPKWVVPVAIDGPVSFLLFAVWTIHDQAFSYVRALASAMDQYSELLSKGSTVVMGDFNSNAIWDQDHPDDLNHTSVVSRFCRLDMVSSYDHHHGVSHGREADKTFYLRKKEDRGHHIDYCFVPRSWTNQLRDVQVGSFSEWSAASDHCPLVVDFEKGLRADL